jgi:hypothetical protein
MAYSFIIRYLFIVCIIFHFQVTKEDYENAKRVYDEYILIPLSQQWCEDHVTEEKEMKSLTSLPTLNFRFGII